MRYLWRLVVDIYEPSVGYDYPVLRHVFPGKTKAEAYGTFRAHMTTDAFLRDCIERAQWETVKCDAEARWLAPGELLGED